MGGRKAISWGWSESAFGAPLAHADDPDRAMRAALAMVARLEALNMRLSSQSLPMLRIGVGIHTGEIIAGKLARIRESNTM